MGQIGDGLHYSFERPVLNFVYHNRQQDWRNKTKQQLQETDRQRIGYGIPEITILQYNLKIFKANPGRRTHRTDNRIIFKGNTQTIYRYVAENNHEKNTRQNHKL